MRHAPLVIVGLTHVAAAESVKLTSVVDDAPVVPAGCTDGGFVEQKRLSLEGHTVRVVDECGSSDLNARLVFDVDGGARTYTSGIIAYRAANMTEAPLYISLLLERTTFATLAGKRALVHRLDTLHREIRMDGTVQSASRQSRVDICIYEADEPACGYAVVECPTTGCKAPDLSHGTLRLHGKRGLEELTIE